jgi:RNA polymerase sigma factor (sigma-70 family)
LKNHHTNSTKVSSKPAALSYALPVEKTESRRRPPVMNRPSPWTDDAIVRAVAGGSGPERDAALQWWFGDEGLQRWVRRYAVEHGGAEADGEDLYHDTFITFDRLIRAGRYRGEASLRTFFCSIAKWQWLNRQKKSGRTVAMETADLAETAQFPADEMYDRERQSVFERLFAALGEKCKKLLTLYQLSYSMKEIAAEMGYASDQVAMNQSSECRKKLKHLIEKNDELKDFLNF